ncbi:MAG: hypothetical protein JWM62_1419 [Frankiales bacterium]|jgi:hypothetical protein|nr:hypothetical protein [Frankiales bacterium]
MKRLLAVTASLSLLVAAGPALAATKAPVNAACKAPSGATVLKPGAPAVESTVTTPVGAGNGLLGDAVVDAGTFVLDLRGKPVGTSGKVTLTLSWDDPVGVTDYELVVNGVNKAAVANPEVQTVKATHCKAIKVGVDVFLGLPVDELTLAARGV